jgi:hypothetical protein
MFSVLVSKQCLTSYAQHQTQWQCHCLAIVTARVRWHAPNGATSKLALDALPKWREDRDPAKMRPDSIIEKCRASYEESWVRDRGLSEACLFLL